MKTLLQSLTVLLLLSSVTLYSQKKEAIRQEKETQADKYFKKMSYVRAAQAYEQLLKKDTTQQILARLGDSYYYNVQMDKAVKVYRDLLTKYPMVDPEYLFKYAQSLRGIGDYQASSRWMKKFYQAKQEDSRAKEYVRKEKELIRLTTDPLYTVENEQKINSKMSDFGTTFYKEGVIFSSAQRHSRPIKRIYAWNKQPFLDLYYAKKDSVGRLVKPTLFAKELNTKYHESSVSFSPDKKVMYFTRNNYHKGKYKTDSNSINKLKIYRAEQDKRGKWVHITELPFNSDEYSTGHPSVSKDGKRLYFTSDMPGSIGKTDIFYVTIEGKNKYGNPINLGSTINTEGREMFPYISEDNTLYFSSDGHFGLGALDVFSSKLTDQGFTTPKNLKAPVNSELDDFSFIIDPKTKEGYLSSNRKGGQGDDDIYSVIELKKSPIISPPCFMEKGGIVVDKDTKEIIPYAKVVLSKGEEKLDSMVVGSDARFKFKVRCDSTYVVRGSKELYKPDTKQFKATKATLKLGLVLGLGLKDEFKRNQRGDLVIKINPIYFDYDQSYIRPDAARELDHIVSIMKKYPNIKIVAGSHTDARGRAAYNEKLSERRAKSTVRYIVSHGIDPSRITARGYGETQLVNNCVDNDRHTNRVKCTKEEHQANRRTEFVIVKE